MCWFYDDVGVFDSEQSDVCIDFTMCVYIFCAYVYTVYNIKNSLIFNSNIIYFLVGK